MHDRRPNLFLIGSMKSGTTYLSQLLAAHPALFMSSPKEPTRFVDPKVLRRAWPWMWRQGYSVSEERYLSLFATAGNAAVIAEASTAYSQAPLYTGVVERILKFNPRARFMYILRDPVERTISHYWFWVRLRREHRSLLAAVKRERQYTDVSYYARQLNEYLRRVDQERIFVLTLEELVARPAHHMARICKWLGIDPSVQLPALSPSNVRPALVEQVRGFGFLDRLRKQPLYRGVAPYLPRAARELGTRLAVRTVRPAEINEEKALAYLRAVQIPQTQELSKLLHRDFPEWATLRVAPAAIATAADDVTAARRGAPGPESVNHG